MVDLAVTAQLQQWTFQKPDLAIRPERSSSESSTSSPKLGDDVPDTLRIDTTKQESAPASRHESIMMDRYLSSEEDLSAIDDGPESDVDDYDDVVIHDPTNECKARTMSISRWDKGRSCDMAVMVSYAFAGRPKVVELADRSPTSERPAKQQRSASLANLPSAAISKLRKAEQAQRLSMKLPPTTGMLSPPINRPVSPAVELESRRPSTSHVTVTKKSSLPHLTGPVSTISSFDTTSSSCCTSVASSEAPRRPSTSAADVPVSARSSVYIPSISRLDLSQTQTRQSSYRQSQFAPLTPASPALSFLSSDPYETSTTNAASPIIKKPSAHKRLRSISMKLALAKIAIQPSKKPYDTRLNGRIPPTPSTPMTPQTAPLDTPQGYSSPNRLRRASTILRPKSRHAESVRVPSPETTAPAVPVLSASAMAHRRMSRMVARGANEREPAIILPPCPDMLMLDESDPMGSLKSKKLRKRKSFMDLL